MSIDQAVADGDAPPKEPFAGLGRARRRGGDLLLTGRGQFLDDITLPGLLHATIVRSPHAHAIVRGIDTARAGSAPGVRLIVTGSDVAAHLAPMPPSIDLAVAGAKPAEFSCLTVDRVRWIGEPVAMVVADRLAQAEAAAALLDVDYELLDPVLDVDKAMESEAPQLYPDWGDNVLGRFPCASGDVTTALADAPHRISGELRMGRHAGAPLETRGYIASWDPAGRLTCWASTQNPHPMRSNLAQTLRIPEHMIRVVAPRLGGAFGHKFKGHPEEALVCLASQLSGAPVKWIETRAESLLPGARESIHRYTAGFDDTGRVLGLQCRSVSAIGAYAAWGGWTMAIVASSAFPGPYLIENYDCESAAVVTNVAPWTGYRGFGKEQATVVLEHVLDTISTQLDLDPADVRYRNFVPKDAFPRWTANMHLDSGDYERTLREALMLSDWHARRPDRRNSRADGMLPGIGLAFELCPEGGDFPSGLFRGYDTTTVRMGPDGSVSVLTGVTDPGTGNETTIAELVAREIGVDVGDVRVFMGDTDVSPYGYGNFSSRSIASGGAAAVRAARELHGHLATAAATLLGCAADQVAITSGMACNADNPRAAVPVRDVAGAVHRYGLILPGMDHPALEVTSTEYPRNFHPLPDEHGRRSMYPTFPYSAHVASVAVDPETGVVRVLDYTLVDDCGVVLSPTQVEGQLMGAVAQGIGGALFEDMPHTNTGQPLATSFKHYLLPRAGDLPGYRIGHTETPSPFTLLGTKGAGESGISGALAVMLNAVNDALAPVGARMTALPLSPPRVLAAIQTAGGRR